MIVAALPALYTQIPNLPRLKQALDYLTENAGSDLADGRYEIDGDQLYVLVQSYETILADDHSKYEAHRRYVDVQYIVSGQEMMGWAALDQMSVTKAYDEAKDIVLGTCPMQIASPVKVDAGAAAIFFPEDAHAPKLAVRTPHHVKKIVVKVALG